MRDNVERARQRQAARFSNLPSLYNALMNSRQLREYCPLDTTCMNILRDSCNEMGLSARAHDKILRVARTIADLEDTDNIVAVRLQEAINYRMLDRNMF